MLEILIMDGGIRCRDAAKGGEYLNVKWPAHRYKLPCYKYAYVPPLPSVLPSCREFYNSLKAEGCSDTSIIKKMIALYIPWRLFAIDAFAAMSLVFGFIGRRGAGKSAGASYLSIFDYLIRGRPVFSNIELAVKVVYRDCEIEFHSRPWSGVDLLNLEDAEGGLILNDEANIATGGSMRMMSNANIAFTNQLQQLRKKRLSMVWNAQRWNNVDSNTLWQTDFVIMTEDAWNSKSYKPVCPGDKSLWKVCDVSGMSGKYDINYDLGHKYISQFEVWNGMVWIRPFWSAFPTYASQSDNYKQQFDLKRASEQAEFNEVLRKKKTSYERGVVESMLQTALNMVRRGEEGILYNDELWEQIGTKRRSNVGKEIRKCFTREREGSGDREFYYLLRPMGDIDEEYRHLSIGGGNGNGE